MSKRRPYVSSFRSPVLPPSPAIVAVERPAAPPVPPPAPPPAAPVAVERPVAPPAPPPAAPVAVQPPAPPIPLRRSRGRPKKLYTTALESQIMVIGRPESSFAPDEITYIERRELAYKEILQNPASRIFVDELLRSEIELRRHDATMRNAPKKDQNDMSWQSKMTKRREDLYRQFALNCDCLGIMPKDKQFEIAQGEIFTDIHKKYLAELNRRRSTGDRIGSASKSAKSLAESIGLEAEKYQSPTVISEEDRKEIVAKEGVL